MIKPDQKIQLRSYPIVSLELLMLFGTGAVLLKLGTLETIIKGTHESKNTFNSIPNHNFRLRL